jgi:HD-like signal output (HDOD) protein
MLPPNVPPWDQILQCARQLPSTPAILGKLQRLLADANSDLDAVCGLLKRDTALAARTIQISNSPYFSPALPHASLEEAVGCVGYNQICRVVGLTIISQLCERDLRYYGIPAERLFENTVVCALAMESLAQFVGLDPRSAYTTGLMRSVGKLVLDRMAAEDTREPYPAAGGPPLSAWEMVGWACDNGMVAAFLLEKWNFSGETVEAVRQHYEPSVAAADAATSAYLLNFAARIAEDLGYGLPGETSAWESLAEKLPLAGLTEAEFELSREETQMAFEQVRQVLV